MSKVLTQALSGSVAAQIVKYARRVGLSVLVLGSFAYFLPKTAIFYAICGLYDVGRNRPLNAFTLRYYFLNNGLLTWFLSPFNIILDLLSLPHVNKGVYRLEDLPPAYRDEVERVIQAAKDADLVAQLEEKSKDHQRTMIFFRWYGLNKETFLNIPAFHQHWNYIETIGVSIFNKKVTTSSHFGFVRPSLRVLFNLNDMADKSSYIVVGGITNYWRDQKLFIFDDTLLHKSVNETEQTRYCLFVDMVRPTPFPAVMRAAITCIRLLTERVKFIYYKNWTFIR